MLTGINFKNYKAFSEGKIEIKPITILLGANSVGKSSLIQLFLLLQETALAENYKSALKLHGSFFSLGEGINLFRKKDLTNPLKFEIEFIEPKVNELIKENFFTRYIEEVINYCFFIISRLSKNEEHVKFIQENFTRPRSSRRHAEIGFISPDLVNLRDIDRVKLLALIDLAHETLSKFQDKSMVKEVTSSRYIFHSNLLGRTLLSNKDEIIHTYDFLKKLYEIKNIENIKLGYEFKYTEGVLKIKSFQLYIGNTQIAICDFDRANENKAFISSEVIDFSNITSRQITELRKVFKTNKTVFSFVEYVESLESGLSLVNSYFVNFISQIIDSLEESFNGQRINYVSPLRAHPKRYYFLDKAKINAFLDTLDGEAIAEIIKENSSVKNSVNTWFKKFNLHIDVGPIKDIIHQIVVKQNSLDLDITDVGFGVSQVLPVIIQGFLSKDKSITLVEQPEIHLHPKMQADLADLFIDITIKKNSRKNSYNANKYLIIETHSEYLLKRLRRRISENKLSPDQVAIYYIEPQDEENGATIKKIDIANKGSFEWPKDFYTGDLAEDITEFLKNQI